MATVNVKSKTGNLTESLKKGETAIGVIIRITDGLASDFMTLEQVEKRMVNADDPFTEIEIGIPQRGVILKPISFKDYTRLNGGGIPLNSKMGKIMQICELKEDGNIPLIAKEININKNGINDSFVAWNIAL